MSNLFLPSSMTGYARNKSESQYPELWDGLVGYWDFSVQGAIPKLGLARDLSGNGNHGTLVGDTNSAPGKFGNVLEFDGVGDYVGIGDKASLDFGSSTDFTISAWIKALTIPAGQTNIYSKFSSDASPYTGVAFYMASYGDVKLKLDDGPNVATVISANAAITVNQWYHIVATANRTGNGQIYINGSVSGSAVDISAVGNVTRDVSAVIGRDSNYDGYYWDGQISDVTIWDRALSAGEIKFLYQYPKALVTPRDDIIVRAPVGAVIERTMTDSLGITDVQTKAVTFARTFTESMGVTDATAKIAVHLRVLAESLGITDATVKAETKLLTEALGIADTQTKDETKALAESLGITDTVVRTCVVIRSFAESLGITDAVGQAAVLSRVLSDALGVTDSMTRIQGFIRTEIETLGMTDAATRTQVQLRVIADALGITDVMQRGQFVTFAETLGITDAMTRTQMQLRIIIEALGITDDVVKDETKLLAEALGITDTQTKDETKLLIEALGITDSMHWGQLVTFTETMGITDDVTKLIVFIRTEFEVVGVTDSIVRVAVMLRTVSDDVGLTDEVSEELSALVKAAWAFVILRQTHS